jgi:hypothetical protein
MAATDARRISFPKRVILVATLAALLFGLFRWVLHQTVARQVASAVQTIPGCNGIRYTRLRIPYFSLQCRIHDAALLFDGAAGDIPIEMIHIRRFRPGEPLPRVLDAALSGVRLEAGQPLTAALQPMLQRLGYRELRGDLQVRWVRQSETPARWDLDLGLAIADAGQMRLSYRLDKVNMQGVALALDNPLHWWMVLPPVELIEARGTYDDQGLWARILIDLAQQQERRPAEVRAALAEMMQRQAHIEEDPAVQAVWRSLERFCRQPKGIVLRTRLARPVPLGQLLWMRRPRDMIRALALEVTVP